MMAFLRIGIAIVWTALALAGCGGDGGGSQTLPTLSSTVSDCGSVTGPCAQLDLAQQGHVISPLLFGDGIEWKEYGQNVLAPDPTNQTPGTFRHDVMTALQGMGFTMMRYPGGTLSDLFHWNEAIGPVASRRPQFTLGVEPSGQVSKEVPYFGPDEFARFAQQLGTRILLTVNVGTGTPEEAAGWVSYWKGLGVGLEYVEIGNEMYLPSPGRLFPAMNPAVYAQRFDAFAAAIRAVDPSLKLGVIGTIDTSFWCYPRCATHPWNEVVMKGIRQEADFFVIHNSYAPGTVQDDPTVYEAMLSYPAFIRFDNSFVEQDIDFFAGPQNKGLPLAVTEHASFFLAPDNADLGTAIALIGRNQNWAAALYSALSYQEFIQDPRIQIANHINPLHYAWQAPIALEPPNFSTYPAEYDPRPRLSPFGLVFKAYRELAGQTYVPATVVRSPTIDTAAVGLAPPLTGTPLLASIGARGGSGAAARGWMFLVNRSLTAELSVAYVLKNLPTGTTRLEVDQLSPADYRAKTAEWTPRERGALPSPASTFGRTISVPRHTLLRIRVL